MIDDRDELLVRKFFDGCKADVPDGGFSRRVMRRLPDRERRLNRIWTAVCAAVGVVLFVKFDWLGELAAYVKTAVAGVAACPGTAGGLCLVWLSLLSVILLLGCRAIADE